MQSLLMNICLHFPLFSMHSTQTHMRLIGRLPTKIPNADIVNHKESMEQLQIAVIKLDDAELEYIQHTLWMARISLHLVATTKIRFKYSVCSSSAFHSVHHTEFSTISKLLGHQ